MQRTWRRAKTPAAPIPGHPGIAVHLVLLASAGNLTLARMQLERVEAPL